MSTRPSGSEETESLKPKPGDQYHFFVKITTNDGTNWCENDVQAAFWQGYPVLTNAHTYDLEVTRIAIVTQGEKSWPPPTTPRLAWCIDPYNGYITWTWCDCYCYMCEATPIPEAYR